MVELEKPPKWSVAASWSTQSTSSIQLALFWKSPPQKSGVNEMPVVVPVSSTRSGTN